jgi:2-desacetyl-2-hydroxyethyl bacteriochlorophyllide A dehydrogenase
MSQTTMKALVYEGPRVLQMREVPIPEIEPGEVLIRVSFAGICGSELGGYLGHNSLRKPPLIMGHEFSGIVSELGSATQGLAIGDRVTVNPLVTCGECRSCLQGETQLCAQRALLGAHHPGAFAQYVKAPSKNVFKLVEHVSEEAGAFAEPFACAIHICRLLQLSASDRLIIFGAGPIGLFALQAAKVYGLSDIVVIYLNEARLEIARELGATTVRSLDQLTSEQPIIFDAAIDAVGVTVTREHSIAAVRPGGTVVFTGLHEASSSLPVNDMIRSEITIKGAFAYSYEDFKLALQWIEEERVTMLPWTTMAPLENGQECFETLIQGPGKVAKYLLIVE